MTRGFVLPPLKEPEPYDGPAVRTLRGKELAARKAELEARDGNKASAEAVRQARHQGMRKGGKK